MNKDKNEPTPEEKEQAQKDQSANDQNPNNEGHKSSRDNRSVQLNEEQKKAESEE